MGGWIASLIVIILSGIILKVICQKKDISILDYKNKYMKFFAMYSMLEKWIECHHRNIPITAYLREKGLSKVAIYGCGDIGKLLYQDLLNNEITVAYGIDKNTEIQYPVHVIPPEKIDDSVDAIIVTAIAYFYDIEKNLKHYTNVPIISLEDIVYELTY